VSDALARMRCLLGDELFRRTPSGMVQTPFAEQLAEPVGHALAMIHGGLKSARKRSGRLHGSPRQRCLECSSMSPCQLSFA
jgi:DNA-binding transcriptional LysR family regulator